MRNRPVGCKAYERGDQWFCDQCNIVWDINDDDPPLCVAHSLVVNVGTPGHVDHGKPRSEEVARRAVDEMKHRLEGDGK